MTKLVKKSLSFLLALIFSGLSTSHAAQVNVAVATNFVNSLRTLAPLVQQKSGHQLRISSASSGVLFAQISQGAPFDVYMAANAFYPQRLVEQGVAVADSRSTYATGRLVLVASKEVYAYFKALSLQPRLSSRDLLKQDSSNQRL